MAWDWQQRNITIDGQWVRAVEGNDERTGRRAQVYQVEGRGFRWEASCVRNGKKADGYAETLDAAKSAAESSCRDRGRPRVGAAALSSTERSRRSRDGLSGIDQDVATAVRNAMARYEWRSGQHEGSSVLCCGETEVAKVTPFNITIEMGGFHGSLTRRGRDGQTIDEADAKAVAEVMLREVLKATKRQAAF